MLTKRIIPCLDVKNGQVVKGVRFRQHQVMGDIVELAERYCQQGADELVFYDITASAEQRSVDTDWIKRIAQVINIPFCVAGGIRTLQDADMILSAGADKISINSPALDNPQLIDELVNVFGKQCVVIGIDSFAQDNDYFVYQYTGCETTQRNTKKRTIDWLREAQQRGAGEIVLNCMNQDGVRQGYDCQQLSLMRQHCQVPLIASGGAGSMADFQHVFTQANVDGALAASVFHKNLFSIEKLKHYLQSQKIAVRPVSPSLIPAIIQDADTREVLMLGYMNDQSWQKTLDTKRVTFYSRSKQRLWTKGESSGNYLQLIDYRIDCDQDTILIFAKPAGPTCHLGNTTCFSEKTDMSIYQLEKVIKQRQKNMPEGSYTTELLQQGTARIAQKVGEEGLEVALAAVQQDRDHLKAEAADLLYHLLVLLADQGIDFSEIEKSL